MHRGNHLPEEGCYFCPVHHLRLAERARVSLAAFALAIAASLPAYAGEPANPLRFAEQAHETRFDAALTRSRRNDTRDHTDTGFQFSITFGAVPQLKWWRVGGSSGLMLRAVDDKTFLVSLPYTDVAGGFRASIFELYAFVGISWLTAGIAHAELAFGGAAPRAGVAFGFQTDAFSVHTFTATEYHPFLFGTSDVRSFAFGLSFALITRPR